MSIERKSLLYLSKVEYAGFTINHCLGCAHGCRYPCYALRMMKAYGKVRNYEQWRRRKVVSNALELLDAEIPRYINRIHSVHLSFTTDPFMYDWALLRPDEEVCQLTLAILRRLKEDEIRATTLTKGLTPRILAEDDTFHPENEYGVTVVSLDPAFKARYEPYAPSARERLDHLHYLHQEGRRTWVSIEPYPVPTVFEQDLATLLDEVAWTDRIVFGMWHYSKKVEAYTDLDEFYKNCVYQVKTFCEMKGIGLHIKKLTPQPGAGFVPTLPKTAQARLLW